MKKELEWTYFRNKLRLNSILLGYKTILRLHKNFRMSITNINYSSVFLSF
jgi:hypothetical protein